MDLAEMIADLRKMIPLNGQTQERWHETDAWIDAIVDKVDWLKVSSFQEGWQKACTTCAREQEPE